MKELCKDLVGKRVRLVRELKNFGGEVFYVGTVMQVTSTHRGRYALQDLVAERRNVRQVARYKFEVLP